MAQIEGDATEEAVMLIASLRQLRHWCNVSRSLYAAYHLKHIILLVLY